MLTRSPLLRALALVAALVATVPLLAACGEDKAAEYDKEGQKVVDQFQTDVQAAQQKIQAEAANPEGQATAVEQMKAAFDKAANGLSELDPPEDAKPKHDQFVSQLRGFGPQLDELADAARNEDAEAAQNLQSTFQTKLTELQQTANDLKQELNN
jgi:hypothetical protein